MKCLFRLQPCVCSSSPPAVMNQGWKQGDRIKDVKHKSLHVSAQSALQSLFQCNVPVLPHCSEFKCLCRTLRSRQRRPECKETSFQWTLHWRMDICIYEGGRLVVYRDKHTNEGVRPPHCLMLHQHNTEKPQNNIMHKKMYLCQLLRQFVWRGERICIQQLQFFLKCPNLKPMSLMPAQLHLHCSYDLWVPTWCCAALSLPLLCLSSHFCLFCRCGITLSLCMQAGS